VASDLPGTFNAQVETHETFRLAQERRSNTQSADSQKSIKTKENGGLMSLQMRQLITSMQQQRDYDRLFAFLEDLSANPERTEQQTTDLQHGLQALSKEYYNGLINGKDSPELDRGSSLFRYDLYTPLAPVDAPRALNAALADAKITAGDGQWHLVVQKTGISRIPGSHDMGVGQLRLIDPKGNIAYQGEFRSGGWGKHGDKSELPGLSGDVNGKDDGINATYGLNWQLRDQGYRYQDASRGIDDRNFLDFNDDPTQTKGREGFALHTEYRRGSLGCIVLPKDKVQALFDKLDAIPRDQRPDKITVLQSHAQVAQKYPELLQTATQLTSVAAKATVAPAA
jgi:hypothetical protein